MVYKDSELIINKDGSIFHLKLQPEDIAENIILVGDPGRVDLISTFLDTVKISKQNREFKTVTGTYKNFPITVISSGIGTDNIDIVINELDALANIDLEKRTDKKEHKKLNFIRIGTSGGLQEDLPVGSFLLSEKSIGFDNLLHFYHIEENKENKNFSSNLKKHFNWPSDSYFPYTMDGSDELIKKFDDKNFTKGVTISAPGFYGPQGRKLRVPTRYPDLNNKIKNFKFSNYKITNFEMESSAIYALSKALGHNALTICAIIANRETKNIIRNYKPTIKKLIKLVLDKLSDE